MENTVTRPDEDCLSRARSKGQRTIETTCIPFIWQKMGLDCTSEKTLRYTCAGLVALTIVQSLLLLIMAASWREPPPLESSTYCVPCNDITQPYNDTGNVIETWRQMYNDSVCCGPIRRVMELRMKKEMSKQYFENGQSNPSQLVGESFITDCEWVEFKTPTVKLVGVVDSVPSNIVQGHSKLRWNKNETTFTANKIRHLELEGEIFIDKPGFYIVSSALNGNASRGTNNTTRLFSHNINLLSHKFGTTSTLMLHKKSIKESDDGLFTSFISAVFKLHKYDRISISVSDPHYLARNLSNDHFTAYYTYDMD
ncbi:uncharacterized protein LOC128218969 [Mya arenaria]|uniref:uncharacterized protein LOC128218969 n=1 Tax=Mya arenaria TaxID=6604 RepID=UPI0022E61FFD|nr:uncharacterized protein LOC128218969 [Mya arenaria]